MDLSKLSEKDFQQLKNQITTEEARRVQLEEQAKDERTARFFKNLSNDMLDALEPEHNRVSCSDSNLINGFGSTVPETSVRCTRCALIQGRLGQYPNGVRLQFSFR
jgi:hypothetical protein